MLSSYRRCLLACGYNEGTDDASAAQDSLHTTRPRPPADLIRDSMVTHYSSSSDIGLMGAVATFVDSEFVHDSLLLCMSVVIEVVINATS